MTRSCENCEHVAKRGDVEPCDSCTNTASNWSAIKVFPDSIMDQITVANLQSGSHYKFSFNGVKMDPYRILDVYGISHPAQQHAIKKLLRAGKSVKSLRQDVEEVQLTLTRWLEMMDESDGR